jgi:hypothetical protein
MLNPIITEYIAADRTDEARRHAARARLARQVRTETRETRETRRGPAVGPSSRWRAWGWALTPRGFGSARPLPR